VFELCSANNRHDSEAPEEINFITASQTVPLATGFKPAMKVLSRKPEDLDDKIDESSKPQQETPEQIRQRQQRELEEKQRRYEEIRARIWNESTPSSGNSTPGTVTPPQSSEGRQNSNRGRGRGRGGVHRNNSRQEHQNRNSPNNQQPASRELYDPGYSPRPNFNPQRRNVDGSPQSSRSQTPREEDQIIRTPRGPDGSGRGGFGFARRGNHES